MRRSWNAQEIKKMNRKIVLETLHFNSPISRSEIADFTGLTRATVTNIIKEFEELGLIEEVGKKSGAHGRRRSLLKMKNDAFYVVGVELARDEIRVGVFDTEANELSQECVEIEDSDTKDDVIGKLLSTIQGTIDSSNVERKKIFGMGVGIPGPVDIEKGVPIMSPPDFVRVGNIPLKSILEEKFQIPVWIDNDSNAAALGEKWYGMGKDYDNFVFVIADIGLGAGIIIDREIYRGSLKASGEVGHNPSCMSKSCVEIESKTSITRLQKVYEDITGKELSTREILELAKKGDKDAKEALKRLNESLSYAIVSLANILSPEAIIIGGRVASVKEITLKEVKKTLDKFLFCPERPKVFVTDFLGRIELLGAAAIAIEEIVSQPYEFILNKEEQLNLRRGGVAL